MEQEKQNKQEKQLTEGLDFIKKDVFIFRPENDDDSYFGRFN